MTGVHSVRLIFFHLYCDIQSIYLCLQLRWFQSDLIGYELLVAQILINGVNFHGIEFHFEYDLAK